MEPLKNENRLDWYDSSDWTRPAELTEEGFLKARAVVTTVGVFSYTQADKSIRRELRLPEEVFDEDSLASLRLKPLTDLHPDATNPVNPDNSGALTVGSVGESIDHDAYRVYASLVVHSRDSIDRVKGGAVRGLSCGYTCDIEWTSGIWMGQQYDCIQRKIRYNHLALVPKGRAGDDAVIRMDSAGTPGDLPKQNQKPEDKNMNLKVVRLDGVEYQAEAKVAEALHKAQGQVEALTAQVGQLNTDAAEAKTNAQSELSKVEAERDSYKERLDASEKAQPEAIAQAFKVRWDLMEKCKAAGVEAHADSDDTELKTAVILKKFPDAKLDGKDEAYMEARFDAACELIASDSESGSRRDSADVPRETKHDSTDPEAEAIKRYNARLDSGWKDQPKNKEA